MLISFIGDIFNLIYRALGAADYEAPPEWFVLLVQLSLFTSK